MNKIKLDRGITLIALIITIIILIVLAGISISIMLGQNGMIEKTKQAAQEYDDATIKEKIELALLNAMFSTNGTSNIEVLRNELNKTLGEGNYTLSVNDSTGEIVITVGDKVYNIGLDGTVKKDIDTIDMATDTSLGNDTSNAAWDQNKTQGAVLDLGETVNLRLKKVAALANGKTEEEISGYNVYNSEDTYIRSIVWSETEPTAAQKVKYGQLAMTADSVLGVDADGTTNELIVSNVPIWAWYDSGTIYIWSKDQTLKMHPHSERMFQGMKNLTNISALSHFNAENVETVRCMFKDTKINDFTVCNNWNITKVKKSLKAGQENIPGNNGFYWMCNNVPSNNHPQFTQRMGSWNSEGTFIVSINIAKRGTKNVPMSQDFKVDYFCGSYTYQQPVTVNNNDVTFDFSHDSGDTYRAICTDKIDLTNVKKIKVEYEVVSEIYGAGIGLYNNSYINDFLLTNDNSQNYVMDKKISRAPGKYVKVLDVSEYTGEYVIALTSWRGAGDIGGIFKVTNIYIDDVNPNFNMPALTSDTTQVQGVGTIRVTSSETYDENTRPYKAFDHVTNSSDIMNVWHTSMTTPQWIQLQMPVQTRIYQFSIKNRDWSGCDCVGEFILYGSNDGNNWTPLTRTLQNATSSNETTYFEVEQPDYYYYYKWSTVSTTSGYSVIDEINIELSEIK